MRPLLLHPGLHKTATTWLQTVPFQDRSLFNSLLSHRQIDDLLVRPHEWDWRPTEAIAEIAHARSVEGGHLIDVLSSEILTGHPFFGSREAPLLAKRVREVVGEAKVLLTVRRQHEWIRSLYQQYIKRGGRLSFIDFVAGESEPQYPSFAHLSLEFHRFTDEFARHFGASNVLVLPQELLRQDIAHFFTLLSRFVGAGDIRPKPSWSQSVGGSPPPGSDWLLRWASTFQDKPLSRSSTVGGAKIGKQLERIAYRLPARHPNKLELNLPVDRIRKSNVQLQVFCPVDLSQFGYDVS